MTREEFKECVKTLPQTVSAAIIGINEGDEMFVVRKTHIEQYFRNIDSPKVHEITKRAPWFMRWFGVERVHTTDLAKKLDAITGYGTYVVRKNGNELSVVLANNEQCTERKKISLQTSVLNMLRKRCAVVSIDQKIIKVC